MLEKEKQHQHLDHSKSDCVATLLKLGADPMVENEAGMSPLAVTLVAGHVDVVEALVAHAPPRTFTLNNINNLAGVLQSQDKYEAARCTGGCWS
jgi:ankyrin repeat protein